MAKQAINVGTTANDKKGDSLRAAFVKVNANFTELYTALGINADGNLNIGAFEFTGSVMSTTDSSAIVIDQAATITSNLSVGGDILPQTANGGDLGSSTLPWRSLYVSNNTIYIGGTSVGVDSQGNLLVGGQSIADVGTAAWNSITGKPTFATVATTGAYADLTGRPTSFNSLVTGAYSVNLESGGVLRANVQGIVSDNQLAVEGSTLISIQTLDGPYLQLFNQGATKEIDLVLYDGESFPTWKFDTNRTLTLPNDSGIKSATNIDITIDTPDSSTFNWRFGADGALTFPDGTSQSTAGGGGGSTLVNGANTVSLGSTGILTFPNGLLKIAGNKIRNVNESVGLVLGSEIEVTVDKTVISNGLTDIEGSSNQHIFEVGSTRIFSAYQVVNSLSEGGPSLTGQQLTELTSTGFQIGFRVINDPGGESEPLTSFSGWTFGTVGQSQAITFPDGTIQTTAPESFSFSVAADDSTQRAVSNNELVKFIGAGGVTTASDAEGNITINYVQGDIRSEGNINIDINLSDSTLRRWQFGEDGNLTFPDGTNYAGKDITLPQTLTGTTNKVSWNFSDAMIGNSTTSLEWNLLSSTFSEFLIGTSSAATPFYFNFDGSGQTLGTIDNGGIFGGGKLTFGSTAGNNAGDANAIELKASNGDVYLTSTESVKITVDASDSSARVWLFDPTGNLTLPQGGNISEGGGLTGAIRLTPSGGANANQALLIYPTGFAEGDHLHLTTGGGATELYLGDDYHYVKLVDGGNVEVKATTANFSDTAAWTFGTDGSLASDDEFIIKAPNGVPTSVYNYSGGGGWNSPPYTNLATTTNGSGTGLTVNVSTAVGGYIDINAITINTPGTGYKTGDLITITNENSLTGTFVVGVAGTNSWAFGTNGSLTLPIGVSIDSSVSPLYPKIIADSGKLFSVQGQGSTGSAALAWSLNPNTDTQYAAVGVNRGGGDDLAKVVLTAGNTTATLKVWKFDQTGAFTFPDGTIQTTAAAPAFSFSVAADDSTQRAISNNELIKFIGAGTVTTASDAEGNITITGSGGSTLVNGAYTASLGNTGVFTLPRMAIGDSAGATSQGLDAVAVGIFAGNTTQGTYAVAVGTNAGKTTQGQQSVAIGHDTGYENQGQYATAVGHNAATFNQGNFAVAIGHNAGYQDQGANSVAIGHYAGGASQGANSIILNATGAQLNQTTANTFTVAPIRNIVGTSGVLHYDASTKEVSYSNSVTAETFNTDQITIVGNRLVATLTNANIELEGNGVGGVVINTIAEATTDSTSRAVGYLGLPQASSNLTQTLTIAESGKHVYISTAGQTITIPAASSVPYRVGTTITFIAGPSATTVTIAITSDTMYLAGTGTTGSRTLAAHGMATAVKVSGQSSAGVWYINGTGLT